MTAQDVDTDTPTHVKAEWPFYWISQINAIYAEVLDRRIKPLGIDIPRWRAMISLYEDQFLSVSEIAEFSAQKLNTTTKVVQRMQADGLVRTRVRPTDGRVTEVCLTEKGDELRKAALKEARQIFDLTFADTPPEVIETLNATLKDITAKLRKL